MCPTTNQGVTGSNPVWCTKEYQALIVNSISAFCFLTLCFYVVSIKENPNMAACAFIPSHEMKADFLERGGHRFESCCPDQKNQEVSLCG